MKTTGKAEVRKAGEKYTLHIVILIICMLLAVFSGVLLIHVRQMQANLDTLSGEVEVLQQYIAGLGAQLPEGVTVPAETTPAP